ncbi:UNKNOWN [Stylonychia lemnae]|uniref:Uncharacterized protein n=1 Tax=Stylonychia lemnae TaxID=5949 RepID=A0A078AQH8_STYLE|nr:UNKNOWN [Stylonychia lemnae]|eukprot:CDW84414.1 UNKNOWN [Stylonychia lemnae]
MIIEESKDRYIRVLEYKYSRVCLLLESLMERLKLGHVIDFEEIEDQRNNLKIDHLSLYRKFLLQSKEPIKSLRSYLGFNKNLERRKQKQNPALEAVINSQPSFGQTKSSSSEQERLRFISHNTTFDLNNPMPKPRPVFRPDSEPPSLHQFHSYQTQKSSPDQLSGPKEWFLEDSLYDSFLRKRVTAIQEYEEDINRQKELDKQCFELMSKLNDQNTSIHESIDGFVNYKINRYKNKLVGAVKKMKGDIVCDSEIINDDQLETQFFVNSIQNKLIGSHNYLLEPFKQTYVLKELKNVIVDKLSLGMSDSSRFTGISDDFMEDLERQKREMEKYHQINKTINKESKTEYQQFIESEIKQLQDARQKIRKLGSASSEEDQQTLVKGSIQKNRSSSAENLEYLEKYKSINQVKMQQHYDSLPMWKRWLFRPLYGPICQDPMAFAYTNNTFQNRK